MVKEGLGLQERIQRIRFGLGPADKAFGRCRDLTQRERGHVAGSLCSGPRDGQGLGWGDAHGDRSGEARG